MLSASNIRPVKKACKKRCIPHEGQYVPVANHHGHFGIHIDSSGIT